MNNRIVDTCHYITLFVAGINSKLSNITLSEDQQVQIFNTRDSLLNRCTELDLDINLHRLEENSYGLSIIFDKVYEIENLLTVNPSLTRKYAAFISRCMQYMRTLDAL